MKIVSDSSALITFENIGLLSLLKDIYREVLIPPAVKKEVFKKDILPDFIKCVDLSQPLALKVLESNLEPGESEAICLYEEVKAELIIIDDLDGRILCERLGIKITGTLGVLMLAKERKLIKVVKPLLDKIIENGFRVSIEVYRDVLKMVNE